MNRKQRLALQVKNLQAEVNDIRDVLRYDRMSVFQKARFIKDQSMHMRFLAGSIGDAEVKNAITDIAYNLAVIGIRMCEKAESQVQDIINEVEQL